MTYRIEDVAPEWAEELVKEAREVEATDSFGKPRARPVSNKVIAAQAAEILNEVIVSAIENEIKRILGVDVIVHRDELDPEVD